MSVNKTTKRNVLGIISLFLFAVLLASGTVVMAKVYAKSLTGTQVSFLGSDISGLSSVKITQSKNTDIPASNVSFTLPTDMTLSSNMLTSLSDSLNNKKDLKLMNIFALGSTHSLRFYASSSANYKTDAFKNVVKVFNDLVEDDSFDNVTVTSKPIPDSGRITYINATTTTSEANVSESGITSEWGDLVQSSKPLVDSQNAVMLTYHITGTASIVANVNSLNMQQASNLGVSAPMNIRAFGDNQVGQYATFHFTTVKYVLNASQTNKSVMYLTTKTKLSSSGRDSFIKRFRNAVRSDTQADFYANNFTVLRQSNKTAPIKVWEPTSQVW